MKNIMHYLNSWNMTAERDGYVFVSPTLGATPPVQQRVSESPHP